MLPVEVSDRFGTNVKSSNFTEGTSKNTALFLIPHDTRKLAHQRSHDVTPENVSVHTETETVLKVFQIFF